MKTNHKKEAKALKTATAATTTTTTTPTKQLYSSDEKINPKLYPITPPNNSAMAWIR